jgi:hypothetical protein
MRYTEIEPDKCGSGQEEVAGYFARIRFFLLRG